MVQQLATIGGIKNDVIVRLGIDTTSAYYTDAILDDWIDNAHRWAAARYKWPFTEGRYSTTFASLSSNEDGYTALEYPEGFRSDTIRLLTIGGKKFEKKNFYKFQNYLEDNTSDTSKIWTDFARRIYINPHASDLSGTVTVWGQIVPAHFDYTDPSQTTIFSNYDEDGNHAIVEKVLSYTQQRERQPITRYMDTAAGHMKKAEELLDLLWKSIQDEQFGYQDLADDGIFKRFDVLRGGYREDIFRRDQFSQ